MITEQERDFIRSWCAMRHIDDVYMIRSLLYWIRIRDNILYSLILNNRNREIYMILCIHTSLKFDGYDELFACNFIRDLREIIPDISPTKHFEMEFEVLTHLKWKLM